jgi:hypothetical protein
MFRRVAHEGSGFCSFIFPSPFTLHDRDAVDGYPPVGSIQSHVLKLHSCLRYIVVM